MDNIKYALLVFGLSLMGFTKADMLADEGIHQHTLENGLKIVVKEDHRSPIFISQLWYKVGSGEENWPYSGVSHMLEHMMFKSTDVYKSGEMSKIIAENGGEENAFTSKDFTTYYQKMHKSKLELAIKIEANRMRNLVLNDEEFEKERQVVIEERRFRIDDNPNARVYEKLNDISYGHGPYKTPVIGYRGDIENMELSVLKDWYDKYYAPNNATLVVVGDVNPDKVFKHAKQYFGSYQENKKIDERKKLKSRGLVMNRDLVFAKSELPFYAMSFYVPSLTTAEDKKEAYSLEMMSYLLEEEIIKSLVIDEQILSDISVGYNIYSKYGTMLTIGFIPASGYDVKDGITRIKDSVRKMKNVNKDDAKMKKLLERTITQIKTSSVYEKDSIDNQAYYIGLLETVGLGLKTHFEYMAEMEKIKVEDVVNAVEKWVDIDRGNGVELKLLEMK